jgi:hypothetical protein
MLAPEILADAVEPTVGHQRDPGEDAGGRLVAFQVLADDRLDAGPSGCVAQDRRKVLAPERTLAHQAVQFREAPFLAAACQQHPGRATDQVPLVGQPKLHVLLQRRLERIPRRIAGGVAFQVRGQRLGDGLPDPGPADRDRSESDARLHEPVDRLCVGRIGRQCSLETAAAESQRPLFPAQATPFEGVRNDQSPFGGSGCLGPFLGGEPDRNGQSCYGNDEKEVAENPHG